MERAEATGEKPGHVERRLTARDVLGEMVRAYRRRWAFLLGAGLLLFIPVSLVEALHNPLEELDTDEVDAVTAVEASALVAAQATTTLIATVFYAGVVAAAVAAHREGRGPSLRELARRLPYVRLVAADLLLALVVAAGLVVLIVPGLVLLIWFALVGPVIEVEHRGVIDGFRRSRALVRRRFWLVAALVLPATLAEEVIAGAAESASVSVLGETFASEWVGGLLGNLLAAPIFALAVVVLFYELRGRSPA